MKQALDRFVLVSICVLVITQIIYVCKCPVVSLTFRLTDDSYYYFNVARHIVQHGRCSFDLINNTNGFHPLWLLCLVPIYWVCNADLEWGLRLSAVLSTGFAGATAFVMYKSLSNWVDRRAGVIALAIMVCPFWLNAMLNGLEMGLLLLIAAVSIWVSRRTDLLATDTPFRHNVLLGLLLGLLFLCRLDTVFVIMTIMAVVVGNCVSAFWHGSTWKAVAWKLMPVTLVFGVMVAPYLAWNLLCFKHLVPISGAIKSTFPSFTRLLYLWPTRILAFPACLGLGGLIVSAVSLAWLVRHQWRDADGRGVGFLMAWLGGSAIHLAYTMLYTEWGTHWWHYAGYLPISTSLMAMAIASVAWHCRRPWACSLVIAGVILVSNLAACQLENWTRGRHHGPWYEAAVWANTHLPERSVIAMSDCGLFGYFSERRTVNLDGVINGFEYQDALRDHDLSRYFRKCGVTHFGYYQVRYAGGVFAMELPARLYRKKGGAIIAMPSAELYRSEEYRNALRCPVPYRFVVWDFARVEVVDDINKGEAGTRARDAIRMSTAALQGRDGVKAPLSRDSEQWRSLGR